MLVTKEEKARTYITGFCGTRNHERCPAVISHHGKHWVCTCQCHEGQDFSALLEPAPITLGATVPNFSIEIPIEAASMEAWAALFGEKDFDFHKLLLIEALRELLTKRAAEI